MRISQVLTIAIVRNCTSRAENTMLSAALAWDVTRGDAPKLTRVSGTKYVISVPQLDCEEALHDAASPRQESSMRISYMAQSEFY